MRFYRWICVVKTFSKLIQHSRSGARDYSYFHTWLAWQAFLTVDCLFANCDRVLFAVSGFPACHLPHASVYSNYGTALVTNIRDRYRFFGSETRSDGSNQPITLWKVNSLACNKHNSPLKVARHRSHWLSPELCRNHNGNKKSFEFWEIFFEVCCNKEVFRILSDTVSGL